MHYNTVMCEIYSILKKRIEVANRRAGARVHQGKIQYFRKISVFPLSCLFVWRYRAVNLGFSRNIYFALDKQRIENKSVLYTDRTRRELHSDIQNVICSRMGFV